MRLRNVDGSVFVIPAAIIGASVGLASPDELDHRLAVAGPRRVGVRARGGDGGVPMGLGFPLGLVRFGDPAKAWYWAVNGACGVMASVCSLGLAMTFGFEWTVRFGFGLYVAAAALLIGSAAPPASQASD